MATNNNNAKLPDEVNYNDAVAASKEYFNGDDLATSAAIYAPYMAIVPTQPIQFPDGGTTIGLRFPVSDAGIHRSQARKRA